MQIGIKLKTLRNTHQYSQDQLAERIMVSRQTISNWENNKSYPDINSLLLLSQTYHCTLDELIRGDQVMVEKISSSEEVKAFKKLNNQYGVMLALLIITPLPLYVFLDNIGMLIYLIILGISFYKANQLEVLKKKYQLKTVKQIKYFVGEQALSLEEKQQEQGKYPYQKFLIVASVFLISLAVTTCALHFLG